MFCLATHGFCKAAATPGFVGWHQVMTRLRTRTSRTAPRSTLLYSILYFTLLYSTLLYSTPLHSTPLYSTLLSAGTR